MSRLAPVLALAGVLLFQISIGQETDRRIPGESVATDSDARNVFGRPTLGVFADEPGSTFFRILRNAYHTTEVPYTFEETVEMSSAIVRGYLIEVLPGRSFKHGRRPQIPAIQTVLLKVQATRVLSGALQDTYLIEYPGHASAVGALNDALYRGELLFFLRPAPTFYDENDVEITASNESEAELKGGQPLYALFLRSTLFAMSNSGQLTSAIDISREFNGLYSDIKSLDALESRILELRN